MRSATLVVLVVACTVLPIPATSAPAKRWPSVQPVRQAFPIPDPEKAVVKTFINGAKGQPLYIFVCRTDKDTTVPGVVYAGDLDCRLIPARYGEVEDNLLIEEHGLSAWYSRGRMFAEELYGDCGSYPEHGRVRYFRLRGMKITLEFLDVKFALPPGKPEGSEAPQVRLASYTLRITVERDPSATRDIAAPSGYLDPSREGQTPPRSCREVQRGIEWKGK